jgi:perosamine synthetase
MKKSKLAVLGGKKTIAKGVIKKWPSIDDIDRKYILDSLESRKYVLDPHSVEFQKEFAQWNGNKYAVVTNSGTAVLHMGIAAYGCGTGDEVIVTAYSW